MKDRIAVALFVYAGLAVTIYGLTTIDTEIVIPSTVYAVMITAATAGLLFLFIIDKERK